MVPGKVRGLLQFKSAVGSRTDLPSQPLWRGSAAQAPALGIWGQLPSFSMQIKYSEGKGTY